MYYALTLKKTRGTPIKSDYEGYLATMFQKNPGLEDCGSYYEYTKGLHVHCLLYKRGAFGYGDCLNSARQHGWSIKLKLVYNLSGWKKYIQKDQSVSAIQQESDRVAAKRTGSPLGSAKSVTSDESVESPNVNLELEYTHEVSASEIYSKFGRIV